MHPLAAKGSTANDIAAAAKDSQDSKMGRVNLKNLTKLTNLANHQARIVIQ